MRMKTNETCKWCDREIVNLLPKSSGSASCAGCHKKIYGLFDEDCRQVIVNSSTAWGDATINME